MAIPAGLKTATASGFDRPSATYTDPTGTVWDLMDTDPALGWFSKPGIKGWGATTYNITTDKIPRGGVSVRATRANEARLTWPLHVWGDTHGEWLDRYRALKRAILMTVQRNKTGVLRVTRPADGTAREIDVMYESGFEGEGGSDDWVSANPVVTFMAPDGYWRASAPVVVPRKFQAGTSFFSPYPTVTSAQVLGVSTVTNPGDVDAWPTWTVTGPAAVITATNNTTMLSFQLTKTLAAGELVTITTQRPTVRGPVGENLIGALNWPDAYLWGLVPGDNSVNFAVSGAGNGSAIELKFYPRFEGA